MINFLHLCTIAAAFVLNFSGIPLPVKSVEVNVPISTSSEKKEDKEFIPWLPDRRLNWDDFQSIPKRNTEAVATTSTSLGIAYQVKNGELSFEITCKFSKIKSWGSVRTDYILAHEQGHFDITEIYARKLHQALLEYEFNRKTYQKDINRIYHKVVEEKESFQNLYDSQSSHSRNKRKQYAWLQIIDELLEDSAPYADYP